MSLAYQSMIRRRLATWLQTQVEGPSGSRIYLLFKLHNGKLELIP